MKSEYDVIVVGAGPAGSVAAATIAGQGLDVSLLEKRQEIGEPVRCGEGIFKQGLDEFIEYDPKWVCAEIHGARIHAPNGTVLKLSQKPDGTAGYVLDRKIFDRALVKQAADCGAEVFVKTQATGLIIEDGMVRGIRGMCHGREFEARARVVIGADGVESKVGRQAGLLGPLKLNDIGTCAEFTVTNIDMDPENLEFYLSNEICPGGYVWMFPKGERDANVGLGMSGTRFSGTHPIEYLKRFVDRRFPGCSIVQAIAGALPMCDLSGPISTGGLMLAGDGARLVDPLLGAGIMNAMISGRMAGNVAAGAINRGDVSAKALKEYDNNVRSAMGLAIRRNYLVKEFLVKSSDRQMNILIGSLRRMNVEKISISDIYKTVATTGLPVLDIIRAII
jgi:digeranylgeranylglycerophospholipid reductase